MYELLGVDAEVETPLSCTINAGNVGGSCRAVDMGELLTLPRDDFPLPVFEVAEVLCADGEEDIPWSLLVPVLLPLPPSTLLLRLIPIYRVGPLLTRTE